MQTEEPHVYKAVLHHKMQDGKTGKIPVESKIGKSDLFNQIEKHVRRLKKEGLADFKVEHEHNMKEEVTEQDLELLFEEATTSLLSDSRVKTMVESYLAQFTDQEIILIAEAFDDPLDTESTRIILEGLLGALLRHGVKKASVVGKQLIKAGGAKLDAGGVMLQKMKQGLAKRSRFVSGALDAEAKRQAHLALMGRRGDDSQLLGGSKTKEVSRQDYMNRLHTQARSGDKESKHLVRGLEAGGNSHYANQLGRSSMAVKAKAQSNRIQSTLAQPANKKGKYKVGTKTFSRSAALRQAGRETLRADSLEKKNKDTSRRQYGVGAAGYARQAVGKVRSRKKISEGSLGLQRTARIAKLHQKVQSKITPAAKLVLKHKRTPKDPEKAAKLAKAHELLKSPTATKYTQLGNLIAKRYSNYDKKKAYKHNEKSKQENPEWHARYPGFRKQQG